MSWKKIETIEKSLWKRSSQSFSDIVWKKYSKDFLCKCYLEALLVFQKVSFRFSEAFHQKCFYKKVFWKYVGEHPCESLISIKLQCNFIEIIPSHGCSHINLLHIFRTTFHKNTIEASHLSFEWDDRPGKLEAIKTLDLITDMP